MGKKQVTILDSVVEEVASIALFIEGKGPSQTAKKFIDEAFEFFGQLSNEEITHRPCKYPPWEALNLRCVNFRKKYAVASLLIQRRLLFAILLYKNY